MPSTTARTLTEHIHDACLAQARRILAGPAHDLPSLREGLAQWYATVLDRISVEIVADRDARGRIDNRSTEAVVWLHTDAGTGELLRVRVRDLVDAQGAPVDAKATARDLRAQLAPVTDEQIAALLDDEAGR